MGQPIIIMGAHGGIGEALARRLKAQGAELFLTARDEAAIDIDAPKTSLDVTDADAVTSVIESADQGDGIKGLAYCIGSIVLKPLKATKDEEFLQAFELNLLGAARALRAAEKGLKKAGGSVVLFSTVAVQQGFTNHSIISAAKGAVEGLTRALATEWAPHVRVNCIAPSLTDTPLAKDLTQSEQMREAIEKMHPIPRLGTSEDIAALAAYLLGEESGWVTGQVMHVDGGRSTKYIKNQRMRE